MQAEVFFIHQNGEQRGPYTAAQLNHLHRCGFVADDTLYWREGMEQWQPVGQIVFRRGSRRLMMLWIILACVAAVVGLFVLLFGPAIAERWREMTSGEFTAESAWWRARGLVREQLPEGSDVRFGPFTNAEATLQGKDAATVVLGGTISKSSGPPEQGAWRVRLKFDRDRSAWIAAPPSQSPDPQH